MEPARPIDLLVVGRGHRSGLDRLLMPFTRRYCTAHARRARRPGAGAQVVGRRGTAARRARV
ncbi:hypothetical protein [Streptosporangium sp. NPDC000396]|uniref:hypothetical protein n=1 Tax=Streptosporangium sp. NPDC000396 TaxID=3366185 RepID=UPI00367F0815